MCVLPATLSNNVPGTEISIGSDTAVNVVVEVREPFLLPCCSVCFTIDLPVFRTYTQFGVLVLHLFYPK
jgi:hypothetical protein